MYEQRQQHHSNLYLTSSQMKNYAETAKPQNLFNIIVERVVRKTQSTSYPIVEANKTNNTGKVVHAGA